MGGPVELNTGRSVVLLLASDLLTTAEDLYPLDRIRMQKAIFLISMRGPARWEHVYSYRPYDWGPYSDQLTSDIGYLQESGYIRLVHGTGRYLAHATSPAGQKFAAGQWAILSRPEQDFLRAVRRYVTNKSFQDLLKEVYAAYPEYASRSRFTG